MDAHKETPKKHGYSELFTNTEIHGLPDWYSSKTAGSKGMWTAILLTAFALLTLNIVSVTIEFIHSPIITSYHLVNKADGMEMPEFFICPSNPIMESKKRLFDTTWVEANVKGLFDSQASFTVSEKLKVISPSFQYQLLVIPNCLSGLLAANAKLSSIIGGIREETEEKESPSRGNLFAKQIKPKTVQDYMLRAGYEVHELFKECAFNSNPRRCSDMVTPYFDGDYGKCFRIHVRDAQSVSGSALSIVLDLNTEAAYPPSGQPQPLFDGVILKVGRHRHPLTDEVIKLPAGAINDVNLEARRFEMLPFSNFDFWKAADSAKCAVQDYESGFEVLQLEYTQLACAQDCAQRLVVAECGCFFAIDRQFLNWKAIREVNRSMEICKRNDLEECVAKTVDRERRRLQDCMRECRTPCITWRFRPTLNSVPFPSSRVRKAKEMEDTMEVGKYDDDDTDDQSSSSWKEDEGGEDPKPELGLGSFGISYVSSGNFTSSNTLLSAGQPQDEPESIVVESGFIAGTFENSHRFNPAADIQREDAAALRPKSTTNPELFLRPSLCQYSIKHNGEKPIGAEGVIEKNFTRWSYDSKKKDCVEFIYSGWVTEGNPTTTITVEKNSFQTRIACLNACAYGNPCLAEAASSVNCAAGVHYRSTYDRHLQKCRHFEFHGCDANGNHFLTHAACFARCKELKKNRCFADVTTLSMPVTGYRWIALIETAIKRRVCKKTLVDLSDCGKDFANRFETREKCETTCHTFLNPQTLSISDIVIKNTPGNDTRCLEPPLPIQDNATTCPVMIRYHYDASIGECIQVETSTPLLRTRNVFATKSHCESQCSFTYEKPTDWQGLDMARLKPMKGSGYGNSSYKLQNGDYIILQISFGSLHYIDMVQSHAMTPSTFISNIGGQMGLWIGCSVITLFKIVWFFVKTCWVKFKKNK